MKYIYLFIFYPFCYRSFHGLSDWLLYLTYATQTRYASAFLNHQIYTKGPLHHLPRDSTFNCSTFFTGQDSHTASSSFTCRYSDGTAYLIEHYLRKDGDDINTEMLDSTLNFGITFAFVVGFILVNCLLYIIPLPAYVKAKFRE